MLLKPSPPPPLTLLLPLSTFSPSLPSPSLFPNSQTRAVVYAALGLNPTGAYTNCSAGGRLLVGLELVQPGHQTNLQVQEAVTTDGQPPPPFGYNLFNIAQPALQVWSV